jgi:hypothetical protein
MAFADEPVEYGDRRFDCGWSVRQQTAADIGDRMQRFARQLGKVDPAFGRVRPEPGMRRFRAGDRGPILEMKRSELTEMIERRGRFDPPRFPAPVGPQGYHILFRNDLMGLDPSHLSITISAGAAEPGANENGVRVWPNTDHSLWCDAERGIQILDAMIQCWDAEWACAYANVPRSRSGNDDTMSSVRPWLAWTAKPMEPRPNPPFRRPHPGPFPLDYAGPPGETRPWHGGELSIWP